MSAHHHAPIDEGPAGPPTAATASPPHSPPTRRETRHSALTGPLMACVAGAVSGGTLWLMGERDAYAPPLLALGLWLMWRLPSGRVGRGLSALLSGLYVLGVCALLWERSGAHPVWQVDTDVWVVTPESLTLKLCAGLFALSWVASWVASWRVSPSSPPSAPPPSAHLSNTPHQEP